MTTTSLALVILLAWASRGVAAVTATGDLIVGRDVVPVLNPGGTYDLCAYSLQTAPAPLGPNAQTVPAGLGNCSVAIVVGPRVYNPPVGTEGVAKPPLNVTFLDQVSSKSGNFFGGANLDIFAPGGIPDNVTMRATGTKILGAPANAAGSAAGKAVDPVIIDPGTYTYHPTIPSILLETETDTDFAGVSFFATDSRFAGPLWQLDVLVAGTLESADDLTISFSAQSILGLDAQTIVDNVRNTFSVAPGSATLTNFDVFNATYEVDQTITFSEGLSAGVETVPEPATVGMLAIGSVGIVAAAKSRRRKRNRPSLSY
jgi:hypothetical protein